ncbi:MAG TPA: lipid II flippase MurJ [Acidimicrobiales bacterium]|nr:lipid II flippase MurJ [Acidimicrobiales bacterium]
MPDVRIWKGHLARPVGLGGLALAAVALGVVQQGIAVVVLGAGSETDALFAGYALPQIVLAVLGTTLANVLVPLLAGEDGEEVRGAAWTLFAGATVAFGGVALVLGSTAPLWTPVLFPGFEGPVQELAVELTRIQLVGMVFSAQAVVLSAVYQSRGSFRWAGVTPVIGGAAGLAFMVLTIGGLGVHAAAWASNVRLGLQASLLYPILGSFVMPNRRASLVREAWRRSRPLVLACAYYRSDILVDRWLASLTPAGGLSLLFLASRLYSVGAQVVNSAITLPETPALAMAAKEERWSFFADRYRRLVTVVLAMTGSLYLLALGGLPVLNLMAPDVLGDQLWTFWLLLLALGGVLVAGGTGQVLSSAHYATGDTRTPTRIGIVGFTVGILLKLAGLHALGLVGIALGTSLYYIGIGFALHGAMKRRLARAR